MAFLEAPSPKQAEVIKQEWNEGPGDLERGVQDLQSMLAANTYLPEPASVDTFLLELFVRGCRLNQERARNKLQSFFVSRSRFRDLFEHTSLNDPPLSDTCKFADIVILPKLTDEGYRVTVVRIKPNYLEKYADMNELARSILLVSDVRMHDENLVAGDVWIYDLTNMRASLAARVLAAANTVRKCIYLAQAAYPQRMKRIHVVGSHSFLVAPMQLMRSCVNEKIRNRYFMHSNVQELFEHISARVLPQEWGGDEESFDILARRWRHRIDELKDYLHNLKDMCNATPAPVLDADIYGTAGAFRKLDID